MLHAPRAHRPTAAQAAASRSSTPARPSTSLLRSCHSRSSSSHKSSSGRGARAPCGASVRMAPPAQALAAAQPADAEVPDALMSEIVADAVVWASQHGLVVGTPPSVLGSADPTGVTLVHAPVAALPVAFPRLQFEQAKRAQPLFNLMVDAVARDEGYLEATLQGAARHDDFTARLLGVLAASRPRRAALAAAGVPEVALGVHRSDYMLDGPSQGFLQVELNTIASSFGCLSSQVTRMHRYTASRLPQGMLDASCLPDNDAIDAIPDAIATAAKAVAAAAGGPVGAVVMVVQPGERNAYDQQWIQLRLWERHRLRTLRRTLAQIAASGRVAERGGALSLEEHGASIDVSVVYFRAGYAPTDYPTEAEWAARALIESSSAAKCPSVAYQLAGCKKVQQDVARPGVLERFVPGAEDGAAMRAVFAGLWGLDDLRDPATAAIVAEAIAAPEAFVLKPQREGGGNNIYGEELRDALASALQALNAAGGGAGAGATPAAAAAAQAGPAAAQSQAAAGALAAYILMQRIQPPPQRSVLVRLGAWERCATLSELGIFGVFCRAGGSVLLNAEVGHLVRTKKATSNEGGVAAGFAVLDSPCLF